MEGDIAGVTASLGVAFNSTFTALVISIIIMFLMHNVQLIQERLVAGRNLERFELKLLHANYLLAGTFVFSAIMNYVLAKWIVTSPAGSSAFNEELGRLTLVSYPMIALPSMVMMIGIFWYLWRTIRSLTGLDLEEILIQK